MLAGDVLGRVLFAKGWRRIGGRTSGLIDNSGRADGGPELGFGSRYRGRRARWTEMLV